MTAIKVKDLKIDQKVWVYTVKGDIIEGCVTSKQNELRDNATFYVETMKGKIPEYTEYSEFDLGLNVFESKDRARKFFSKPHSYV